jgi:Domain of unknown function (DUF1906)
MYFIIRTISSKTWSVRRYFISCSVLVIAIGTPLVAAAGPNDYCKNASGATAVDLSQHVSQDFLAAMKANGIKTVIRYYDHEAETLPGKTLHAAERHMITDSGFDIGVVFQHWNNRFSSFTAERGRQDAERSLVLAAENDQNKGSAIYFGVDGSWQTSTEVAHIEEYFESINDIMKDKGYRVGVYGSGLICEKLLDARLASLCWLANARGWPKYKSYYDSKGWALAQSLPVRCGGIADVDFNLPNERFSNFGQFGD